MLNPEIADKIVAFYVAVKNILVINVINFTNVHFINNFWFV